MQYGRGVILIVRRGKLAKAGRIMLGVGATKVMEKLVAKNLHSRLELSFTQHDGWTLVDYVNHAKEAKRDG